jgi:hypothetical protein
MQESLDRWIDGRERGSKAQGRRERGKAVEGEADRSRWGKREGQISNPRRRSTRRQTQRTNPSKRGLDPLGELSKQPLHLADLRWRQGFSSTSGVGEAEAEMLEGKRGFYLSIPDGEHRLQRRCRRRRGSQQLRR